MPLAEDALLALELLADEAAVELATELAEDAAFELETELAEDAAFELETELAEDEAFELEAELAEDEAFELEEPLAIEHSFTPPDMRLPNTASLHMKLPESSLYENFPERPNATVVLSATEQLLPSLQMVDHPLGRLAADADPIKLSAMTPNAILEKRIILSRIPKLKKQADLAKMQNICIDQKPAIHNQPFNSHASLTPSSRAIACKQCSRSMSQ